MKVFTFFYNRYDSATTSLALAQNGIEHNVLIHSAEDADKFKRGGVLGGKVVVTGNPKGLAYQRNTALDMMDFGEWAVFASDDFRYVLSQPLELVLSTSRRIEVTNLNQDKLKFKKSEHLLPLRDLFLIFPKLIEIAEANKIHLVGFASNDNPRALKNKFTTRGLADGRLWLVKKSSLRFDHMAQSIDDYAWTVENLLRFGNVLVLNWVLPVFARYTAGGYGTEKERLELKRAECAYLVSKYEPIIRIAKKPGWPEGSHIRLFASNGNIQAARKRLGIPTL